MKKAKSIIQRAKWDHFPLGYLQYDGEGNVLQTNLALQSWLSFSRDELAQKNILDICLKSDSPILLDEFSSIIEQSGFEGREITFLDRDNTPIPFLVSAITSFELKKRKQRVGLFFTNVSSYSRKIEKLENDYQKQLELTKSLAAQGIKLYDVQEKLKLLNGVKDEFLAICSHDLKSPIGLLKTGSDMLLDGMMGELPENQKDLILRMQNQADYAIELITDLLDLSKIEHGIWLEYANFYFKDLIEECVNRFSFQAEERNIEITVDMDTPSIRIYADRARIAQVLNNLLSNALKFCEQEEGKVRISLSTFIGSRYTDSGAILLLSIWNNGTTIPKERLEGIFNKFEQARTKDSKKGTGLGLAICKHICKSHRGNIWAMSNNGGTNFFVTLPFAVVESIEDQKLDNWFKDNARDLKVLIVNQDKAAREKLRAKIDGLGVHTYEASNGVQAISTVEQVKVDLVFLDIEIETTYSRGVDILHSLRGNPETHKTPIVLFINPTSIVDIDGICRDANGTIFKPVSDEELVFKLKRILKFHRIRKRVIRKVAKPKALLLDADPTFRLAIGHLLEEKFDVVYAKSGYEALFFLGKQKYDLLFVDCQIPDMETEEFLDRVTSLKRHSQLYLMSCSTTKDEEFLQTYGVKELLIKPLKAAEAEDYFKKFI